MNENTKKFGLIAVVVIALAIAIWSARGFFMGDAPAAGPQDASRGREMMEKMRESGSMTGGATAPGAPGGGAAGESGSGGGSAGGSPPGPAGASGNTP
jgi:hypothetical protein